jgi:hypothetical protein
MLKNVFNPVSLKNYKLISDEMGRSELNILSMGYVINFSNSLKILSNRNKK